MQNQTIPPHILRFAFPFTGGNRKLKAPYPSTRIHLIFFRKIFCSQKTGGQHTAFQVPIGKLVVTLLQFLHFIHRGLAFWRITKMGTPDFKFFNRLNHR